MATSRDTRLRAYLAEGARLPFVWGVRDCISWPCGWVEEECGFDPMTTIRGSYDSRVSCARLLRAHGGLVALARRGMANGGIAETEGARRGDVGLIGTNFGPMGAIRAASTWAVKSSDGVAFLDAPPLVIWRI